MSETRTPNQTGELFYQLIVNGVYQLIKSMSVSNTQNVSNDDRRKLRISNGDEPVTSV